MPCRPPTHRRWASASVSPTSLRATGWCDWTAPFSVIWRPRMRRCGRVCWRRAPRRKRSPRRPRANSWWRLVRIWMSSSPRCSASRRRRLALARDTHALDPIHACKRLFVQRQAVKKYPDPSGFDGAALRADAGGTARRAADRSGLRRSCRGMGEGGRRRGARRGAALRRLGDADRGRPCGASRRHAVPRAAPGRLQASGSGRNHRARRRDDAAPARASTGAIARGLR